VGSMPLCREESRRCVGGANRIEEGEAVEEEEGVRGDRERGDRSAVAESGVSVSFNNDKSVVDAGAFADAVEQTPAAGVVEKEGVKGRVLCGRGLKKTFLICCGISEGFLRHAARHRRVKRDKESVGVLLLLLLLLLLVCGVGCGARCC